MRARGTTNSNSRGGTPARRARRKWLLKTFGDGVTADCQLKVSPDCLGRVDEITMSIDRHPIPGWKGGKYVQGNIRPSCTPCNLADGCQQSQEAIRARATETESDQDGDE